MEVIYLLIMIIYYYQRVAAVLLVYIIQTQKRLSLICVFLGTNLDIIFCYNWLTLAFKPYHILDLLKPFFKLNKFKVQRKP